MVVTAHDELFCFPFISFPNSIDLLLMALINSLDTTFLVELCFASPLAEYSLPFFLEFIGIRLVHCLLLLNALIAASTAAGLLYVDMLH